MKIDINSNIDWVAIIFIIAIFLFFVTMNMGETQKVQSRQQTIQKAIERGWTIEQAQKLK